METKIYFLIFGMWLANYLPRMLPMVVLSKIDIPPVILTWLEFIPAAVLAAILAPSLIMPDNKTIDITLQNKDLIAAIPSFFVAVKTRSLVFTLIVGMLAMALLKLI